MSLILGIHLLERIYLVSDTRLSTIDGKTTEDDFLKIFAINSKISALAAGNTLPASYILNKLRELTKKDATINQFIDILNANARKLINDYVNESGYHHGKVALIFGGYNNGTTKKIEASKLGHAMSGELVARGEGTHLHQSIDKRLLKIMHKLPGKGKGDYLVVDGVKSGQLFSIELDISSGSVSEIKHAESYEYIIYHPGMTIKALDLPPSLISKLEFRDRSNNTIEETLYQDAEMLINFVINIIKDNNFKTVGGNILASLQSLDGFVFPTGELYSINEGKLKPEGYFKIISNKFCYELNDGKKGEYRHLENYWNDYLKNNSKLEMNI